MAALRARYTDTEIAVALHVTERSVQRRRPLSAWEADRIAVALGEHPAEIWGEQWFQEATI